jgi:hypothetical protein
MSLAYLGLPFFGLAYRPLAYRGSNSMAQTGFTPILHYASGTASAVPDASFLTSSSNGAELAVNYTDGKLFYKDNAGAVQVLAWKTTPVTAGGTGLTSLTAGYVPFGSGTSALGNSSSFTYTTGTSTLAAPVISASTSMASAGNMLFSGTATRIQGDFSNATLANRTAFQDKTTNNPTGIYVLPNGTNQQSGFVLANNSDPTNAGYLGFGIAAGNTSITSAANGSGTALPLVFYVGAGGPEVARFPTNGNFQFSGTGQRIQGDFSNATVANRTLFQDKTTNNASTIGVIPNGTGASSQIQLFNNSDSANSSIAYLYADASFVQLGSGKSGTGSYLPLQFAVNNSEVGRVALSGAWSFGGTTINNGTAGVLNAVGIASRNGTGGSCAGNTMNLYWSSPNAYLYVDGSNIGAISVSSDYRVKQNIVTQTANAVDRINALRPVQYQFKDAGELFKADGVTREGFIAHELQAVIPSAVFGAKDELTKDGEIQPQSLKLDALVSVLTKAVQELSARVVALEAK